MRKIKVTIDPGHGGDDRWNRGPTGYIEADGVLEMSLYLRDFLLKSNRFDVTMTRTRDRSLTLQQRTNIAVDNNADMLLSIHTNGFNGNARGPEVWISRHEKRRDGPMGREITRLISEEYNVPNRGVKDRVGGSGYNDYHGMIRLPYLASDGEMRPFIIEALFHDNRHDEAILKQSKNLKRIAELIAKAVYKEYSVPWVDETEGGDDLYRVQTGAFKNKSNAESLEARLKRAGFDTYLVKADGLYKVQVGAYSNKDNADRMAKRLEGAGYDTYITTRGGDPAESPGAYKHKGKRVEAIADRVNFYDTPRWNNPSGQFTKGQGWIIRDHLADTGGSGHYEVENSKGDVYYITARKDLVRIV